MTLDVGGVAEVAAALDVPYRTVVSWQQRGQMPEPVGVVGGVRVYDIEAVRVWMENRERPPSSRS